MSSGANINPPAGGGGGPAVSCGTDRGGVNTITTKEAIEFAWKLHGYTNEYVRFGDPKAGIGLALVAGLIATLFTTKAHHCYSLSRLTWFAAEWDATLIAFFTTLAFWILVVSAGFFIAAVNPRLYTETKGTPGMGKLVIYYGDVAKKAGQSEYLRSLITLSDTEMLASVSDHTFILADIADRKFWYIKWGIWIGAVGATFSFIALLFIRTSN